MQELRAKVEEVEEEFAQLKEEGKVDEVNRVFLQVLNSAALEVFQRSPFFHRGAYHVIAAIRAPTVSA